MHSALVLGELIKNKYGQASRWDLANGYGDGNDHGMFSKGDEPDNTAMWNPRPTFYYMYYFQKYFGDHMVSSTVTGNSDIVAYASKFESGQSGIIVVNKSTTEQIVSVNINHFGFGDRYYVYTLTGGTDNGEFSRKVFVNGKGTALASGGPPNVGSIAARAMNIGSGVSIAAPARSVNYILVENGENIITANEDDKNEQFNVYPNPSNGTIRIDFPSTGFTKVELVDTIGNVVLTQQIEATQLSLEIKTNIPSGLYVVRLTHKNKIRSSKILIE